MLWTRSEFLTGAAGALLGLVTRDAPRGGRPASRMGIGMHSYGFRRFDDPIAFLEHGQALGAGGVQVSLGVRDDAYADRLRAKAEENKLYL